MSKDKRCVLIPGYRMSANEWHHVMWGRPEDGKFGRIPKGIQAALLHNADLVYWGGGTDAQQTLEFARKCENELVGLLGDQVRPFLHKRAHIGREGTRTTAEIAEAMLICNTKKIKRLVLVTDRIHIIRTLNYAIEHKRLHELVDLEIDISYSDTSFSDGAPVVYEPRTPYRDNLHDVVEDLRDLDVALNGNVAHARQVIRAAIDSLRPGRRGNVVHLSTKKES